MTQIAKPVDVEGALASALGIAAPPVPEDLTARLPYAVATRTGGSRAGKVVDTFYVDFDVWCAKDEWGLAHEVAAGLLARAEELPRSGGGAATWCAVSVETHPYNNPDPVRPDLARVTFAMTITARAVVEDWSD